MDDVVEAIHKDSVDKFISHLNSHNTSIQFTAELQVEKDKGGNQHLPILDLDIQRLEDGSSRLTESPHTQTNVSTSITTILYTKR